MAIIIPRPPRQTGDGERDRFELTKWYDAVWRALSGLIYVVGSGVGTIAWAAIDFAGSTLANIETRTHNLLQDIQQANDTDTSTTGGKHTSNAQLKKYEDHRASTGNPHSTAHSNLSTIAQADDTSTNTGGGKHVTNAQLKKYEDHRTDTGNPHSTAHADLSDLGEDDHAQYLLAEDATDRETFAAAWIVLADMAGVTPVADGTYTVGKGTVTDGEITVSNGIITAITEASDV